MSAPVLTSTSAVEVAGELATLFAKEAGVRDAERIIPHGEIAMLKESGLLAITVPREYGGPGLAVETVAEVFRLLATGDPSIAQIPHSHFVFANALRLRGDDELRRTLFAEVLDGASFGNAQAEAGTKHVRDLRTTLHPDGQGDWRLEGTKSYCTGALFADRIPVLAHRDEGGPLVVAWVDRHADGVTVTDDWQGMGQRTTASGSVVLENVAVPDALVMDWAETFDGPSTYGAFAQVLHAAIDAGIARAALRDAAEIVTTSARPYPDAGVSRAADDPLVVHAFGEVELAVRGAEALVAEAARAVDRADADLDERSAGEASLAVAAARAATTQASLEAGTRLFEVAGTRSALEPLNLDRHWRNARTHTLHDPAGWKVQHLGRFAVDGVLPPRHGQI
ncbi:SfnB family sulfur acquisition oxidoreductase [Nocardioides rotundus]|uniref:SfnB family sulfur acquisition oxidoreductase n=1 Tax=Nocardioides rotundus TaxID=1774216 RepID=UPI001CBD1E70|nr:SfnB family sulfur acquisition oxidoreductase [Nocardioides rotundus]UAL30558.1 SfnB family sulfur acquisition oxidoreductase [Nocardioides rotundus]